MAYLLRMKPTKQAYSLRGNLYANHSVGTRHLLKQNGSWSLVETTLTTEQLQEAERVVRGGYEYTLSDEDGFTLDGELAEAGLEEYVELIPVL